MKLRLRAAAVGGIALLVAASAAWSAGNWYTLPVVGSNSFCGSTVSGTTLPTGQGPYGVVPGSTQGTGSSICGQTIPAGPPALTGLELIPADTQATASSPPQTVTIPVSLLGTSTNRLIGGDFTTNLAQRLNTTKGIAALAGITPTAAVITADRWWVISHSGTVTATIDSTASTATVPALSNTKALRIARTSASTGAQMCVGQTLDQAASAPLIGNNAVFSFWEFNGPTMSATNGNITVNIDYTSAADGAATQATLGFAGVNGSKFALGDNGQTGTPTNYTNAITGVSPGTTGTVISGIATIPASTTWTRYAVFASIPVNVPGTTTPVTSVSVSICFTPTATTSVATDYIEIEGLQLEAKPSTVTPNLPNGVISPTSFERRPAAVEAVFQYYYWYFNYENQSAIQSVATCVNPGVTSTNCVLPLPTPMRLVPAMQYTAGFQAFTTTGYSAVGACTGLAATVSYALTPSNAQLNFTCTAATTPAAGTGNILSTLGTSSATGIISASAEP